MTKISFSFRPKNPKEGDHYFDIILGRFLRYDGISWNIILSQEEIDIEKTLFDKFKNTKLGKKLYKVSLKALGRF